MLLLEENDWRIYFQLGLFLINPKLALVHVYELNAIVF